MVARACVKIYQMLRTPQKMKVEKYRNTLLRVFQTLRKFCHSFGHLEVYMALYGRYFLTFDFGFYLAFFLAFILALILASYLTFCSGILPGIYSDTFSDMGTAGPQPRAPDLSGRSQLRPGS